MGKKAAGGSWDTCLHILQDPENQTWGRTGSYITAVNTDSAILQLPSHMESRIPLHSDHSKIVKFDSKSSLGYRSAIEKLREFAADALNVVSKRFRRSS